jgi:hypothetical protein
LSGTIYILGREAYFNNKVRYKMSTEERGFSSIIKIVLILASCFGESFGQGGLEAKDAGVMLLRRLYYHIHNAIVQLNE